MSEAITIILATAALACGIAWAPAIYFYAELKMHEKRGR